ncbi:MAG: DUF2997 domain-containing protein, partial [Symploca sp. SIO2G7]|nr:DUF2997 domain-containing protein [Symploca sp. SIO2G7]
SEVTAAIEAQLGQVLSQERTSEFYAQKSQSTLEQADSQSNYSSW